MNWINNTINATEDFLSIIGEKSKQSPEDYMWTISVDDNNTFTLKDGSLMSVVRVYGSKVLVGEDEFITMTNRIGDGIKSAISNGEHAIQIYFSQDPDAAEREILYSLQPCIDTSRRLGLDFDDIFADEIKTLSKYVSSEKVFMCFISRPKSISKEEAKQNMDAANELLVGKPIPRASEAPNLFAVLDSLRAKHSSFISSMMQDLTSNNILADLLDVHKAAWEMSMSVDPDWSDDERQICLVGDKIPARYLKRDMSKDVSGLMWPTVRSQMCPRDAVELNSTTCICGDRVYAPMYMHLAQQDIKAFKFMVDRMSRETADDKKIPWRMSFLIETGGLNMLGIKNMLAALFGFTSPGNNNKYRQAVKALKDMVDGNDLDVKLRVDFATWAPKNDLQLLDLRASKLARAIQSWGQMDVRNTTGDPVQGFMSSTLGLTLDSVGTPSAAALSDIMINLPIFRPASPWSQGSILLRTPDGKLFPYMPFSNQQTSVITIMIAEPRYGKSLTANCFNFALVVAPGNKRLPRISIVDFGSASAGFISLIQYALPERDRHLARLVKMQMSDEYAVNPFDTQLGCRYPIGEERSFMANAVRTLVTIDGMSKPIEGMSGLVDMAIEESFKKFADDKAPKRFSANERGVELIIKALGDYGIRTDERTTWWEVVDALFDVGAVHEAMLAQRYAVPTLIDIVSISREQQFEDLYGKKSTEDGEPLLQAFSRMLSEAVRKYPIIAGVTRFDIGDARIVAIDIESIVDRQNHGCQQNALAYLLAMHLSCRHFLLKKELLPSIPAKYRAYHEKRILEIKEDLKHIQIDEYHRGSGVESLQKNVDVYIREGGKNQIGVTLISQHVKDFPPTFNEFATVKLVFSPQSDDQIRIMRSLFELTPTMEFAIKNRIKSPGPDGSWMFGSWKTKEHKNCTQLLNNTVGGLKLWAFSTTNEDMYVRDELYERIGDVSARRILKQLYPGGSLRAEVERRKFKRKNSGVGFVSEDDENRSVLMTLVDDIERQYHQMTMQGVI